MLELLQDLFPWLVGFYLLDAVASVRRGQALYAARLGGFRRLGPGLHLPGLLPTARLLASLEVPPLWRGGALWILAGGGRYDPPVVRPDDLEELSLGPGARAERDRVRLGERTVVRAPTPAHARALAGQLAAGEGAEAKRARREAGDLEAVRAALAAEAPWVAAAQALATALFLLLFGALPAVAWGGPALRERIDVLLVALGAAHLATLAACAGLLRRARLPWREVAGQLAPLALFPPYAAHPLVHLRRDALAGRDPAVAAAALLPGPALRALARRELVRFAASRAAATRGPLAEAWAGREEAWRVALARAGVPIGEALAPPAPAAGAAAFCPSCAVQYRSGFDTCADCGLALERWPAEAGGR